MQRLKDSPNKELIRRQYDQLWLQFEHASERKVQRILDQADKQLLSKKSRFSRALDPFKTHLTWILPLCVVLFFFLLYVGIIWLLLIFE